MKMIGLFAQMRAAVRAAAVAAAACLVLTGCNRPVPDVDGGVPSPRPTGDSGGRGGLAPGSPMTMPARTQDQGEPLDPKLAHIRSQLAAQCGGRLCVKVKVEYDRDGVNCSYKGSDPAPGSTFYYHKNLIVTVYASCEEEPLDNGSPSNQPNDGPSEEQPAGPGAGTGSS